jgi:flavin-binding protein dodecin
MQRQSNGARSTRCRHPKEKAMAKKSTARKAKNEGDQGVYRVIEVIGSSPTSWEEAARSAVETAAGSLRDLRIAEVMMQDVKIEDGRVVAYRTKVSLSFKYEP